MDWREQGILLTVRPHGESAVIADLFTRDHGRHMGVVRGGVSRRLQPVLQPGAQIDATWRARLDEHIGHFAVEPVKSRSAILSDRLALAALNAACALLHFALPERDPHPALYDETAELFDALATGGGWLALYLHWELLLLEELGYGLDLTACAVTGTTDDLAFVSPRSGRAVSREAAGGWADRLLALPACLSGAAIASGGDLAAAFALTGHFLEHRLAADLGHHPLPEARRRFAEAAVRAFRDT